jgi:hypothetical protein
MSKPKALPTSTILFIIEEAFLLIKDLVKLFTSKKDIKDSEYYKRQPTKRKITILRQWRKAQQANK